MGTCCGESEQNMQLIATAAKENHKWSARKMEGDEGLNLNTVECLRGRLLKERQASRVAKEEADSMGNKLVELEMKLREEIKLREKAERKLRFLKKKLESFNISSISRQSVHSDSSEKCENSCGSSPISSSSTHSATNETKHHRKKPACSENAMHKHNVSETSALIQTHDSPSTTKDCDSRITDDSSCNSDPGCSFPHILCGDSSAGSVDLKNDESRPSRSSSKSLAKNSDYQDSDCYCSNPNPRNASPENVCNNPNPSYEDLKNDESRLSSLSSKSSVTEKEDDHGDFFDNSLALVPVNFIATSQTSSNPKPANESVLEALDALRLARERLQFSMGTGQMIQLCPT